MEREEQLKAQAEVNQKFSGVGGCEVGKVEAPGLCNMAPKPTARQLLIEEVARREQQLLDQLSRGLAVAARRRSSLARRKLRRSSRMRGSSEGY